jgi:hypothetical protein
MNDPALPIASLLVYVCLSVFVSGLLLFSDIVYYVLLIESN